jgi:hypothetical protein
MSGGGQGAVVFVYYTRGVHLVHRFDSTKNLQPTNVGEALFAMNAGDKDNYGGIYRETYTYTGEFTPAPPFVCDCDDSVPANHVCLCVHRGGKVCDCTSCEICFPACSCTGPANCTCLPANNCTCTGCINAYLAEIEAFKALGSIAQAGGDAVNVSKGGEGPDADDPTGVITLSPSYNSWLYFTFADADITPNFTTDTIVVSYKYAVDPRARLGNGQVTIKTGDDQESGTGLPPVGFSNEYASYATTGTGTFTFDLTKWPAGADQTGILFCSAPGRKTISMVVTGVTIKPPVDPGAALGAVTFGAGDTAVSTKHADGEIAYAGGGYTWTRGAAWQEDIAYFKVNLGDGYELSDYASVTLKVTLSGDGGYKRVGLLIAETEAAMLAINNNDTVYAASVTPDGATDYGPQYNFPAEALEVTLNINQTLAAEFTGQELYMSFFVNSNASGVMTVTDVEFVLAE